MGLLHIVRGSRLACPTAIARSTHGTIVPPCCLVFACLAACLAAGFAVATLLEQGCYKRVVGVKGLGGSSYEVSEPYQSVSGKLDDWIFGPQPGTASKIKPPPSQN